MNTSTIATAVSHRPQNQAGYYTDSILANEAAPLVAWCEARSGQVGIRSIKAAVRLFRDFGNHPDYGRNGTRFAAGVSAADIRDRMASWERTESPEAQALAVATAAANDTIEYVRAWNRSRRARIQRAREKNDCAIVTAQRRWCESRHAAAVAYAAACPCDESRPFAGWESSRSRLFSGSLAERQYAAAVSAELTAQAVAYYRHRMTPESLLRQPKLRRLALDCANAGKSFSTDLLVFAPRAVAVEAVQRMTDRRARQRAAAVADPLTDPRRFARELAIRKADRLAKQLVPLQAAIEPLILRHYRECAGRWAGGENSVTVRIGSPSVTSKTYTEWSRNKKWSGTSVSHTVTVPETWGRRVKSRGLAVVDGLVTLDARIATRADGIDVYAATWVRQARGVSLDAERGWIATDGTASYHSTASAAAALTGLRRKISQQAMPTAELAAIRDDRRRRREERKAAKIARLVERIRRYDLSDVGHVVVSLQDSYRAGNCVPGTLEFRDRLFSDGRSEATIAEIVQAAIARGVSAADLAESSTGRQFVAACLQAIRRYRNVRRLVQA